MKQLYLNYLALFLLLLGTNFLSAQAWGNLGSIFNFLPEGTQELFDEEFEDLYFAIQFDRDDGLRLSDFDLELATDSMFYYLGPGTIDTIDEADPFMDFWQYNQDQLDILTGENNNNNVSPEDSLILAEEFIRVEDIWNNENDSLNTVIDDYQTTLIDIDSVGIDGASIRWDYYHGSWYQTLRGLRKNTFPPPGTVIDPEENVNVVTVEGLLDTTLLSSIFDFEIAYGQEFSDLRFYNETYSARSSLIRIASVPKLNQLFEARWAVESSFFNSPDLTANQLLNPEIISNSENVDLLDGLNPLIINANFAVTYLPKFGTVGQNAVFRLYSSIGMEASSYIPAHREDFVGNNLDASNRVGKTTGCGPQIGAGFVLNYFNLSFYSYGTVTTGVVNESPEYRYDARTINAGIRFGDAVNIRYTMGNASWAPEDTKSAKFSRFTVGIILDELRRP